MAAPQGDPAALERLAAELDGHASDMEGLASSTARTTADIKTNADWTGSAADAYTGFTTNLTHGVGSVQAPLSKIASSVRSYAGYLRVAQEKVSSYNSAAQLAASTGHPTHVTAAQSAGQAAQSAVADANAAGNQAAAEVSEAKNEMENPFGPDGPVRKWIETIHSPWDLLIGDAAVARALARVEEGEGIVKTAKEFQAGLAGLLQTNAQKMNEVLDLTNADAKTQADEILRLLTDTEKMAEWNKGMMEAGEALTKGGAIWKGVGASSDLLSLVGDYYTIKSPEDGGAMATVDRSVAGVNAGLSVADLAALAIPAFEVPVVGQVALVATGVYLGGDFLYHHWTPFRNVCNDVGHATVAGVKDVASAATSGAKDLWHGITSL